MITQGWLKIISHMASEEQSIQTRLVSLTDSSKMEYFMDIFDSLIIKVDALNKNLNMGNIIKIFD